MKSNQYYIRLGEWNIHPSTNQVSKAGNAFFLKPRLMRLFVILLEQPDKIFIKEELIEAVWEDRIVTDNLLAKSISELRQVIDSRLTGVSIETIRSVGYKLTCDHSITLHQSGQNKNDSLKANEKSFFHSNENTILISSVAGIISLFLILLWLSQTVAPSPITYNVSRTPITSKIGMEWQTAISPEGANLAYSWRENQSQESKLYVRHIHSASARRLTSSKEKFELNPVWSPDGQKIAFLKVIGKSLYQLQLIPLAGGAEQALTNLAFFSILQGLQWDAKYNQIIFSGKKTPTEPYAIYAYNLSDHQIRKLSLPDIDLYGDHFPSLLPNGELAFIRSTFGMSLLNSKAPGASKVMLLDLEANELSNLQQLSLPVTGFAFSPPLNQFVISLIEQEGYHYQFVGMNLDGTLIPITSISDHHPTHLSAHPVLPYLIYEAWNSKLDVYQFQDSLLHPFLSSTHWDWHPRFSKNSQKLAFLSARNGSTQIWICDKNQPELALPVSAFQSKSVNWIALAPDEKSVLIQGHINQVEGIHSLDINTQKLRLIKKGPDQYAFPEYGLNGNHIYYASNKSGEWQIWQCQLNGTNEKLITSNGGYRGIIQSIQQDTFLIYTSFKQGGLWKKNLNTGQDEEIFPEEYSFDKMNFSATPEGLYYYKWQKGQCYLYYYDFQLENITLIKALDGVVPEVPSLSTANNGEIFISLTQKIEADLMKLELLSPSNEH